MRKKALLSKKPVVWLQMTPPGRRTVKAGSGANRSSSGHKWAFRVTIGLIYIRNTAQGMNMIIGRGLRANRAEGRRRKSRGEKSLSERNLF